MQSVYSGMSMSRSPEGRTLCAPSELWGAYGGRTDKDSTSPHFLWRTIPTIQTVNILEGRFTNIHSRNKDLEVYAYISGDLEIFRLCKQTCVLSLFLSKGSSKVDNGFLCECFVTISINQRVMLEPERFLT